MEKAEKEKEITSDGFDKNNYPNDYKLLVQNLKSISETIDSLEKKLLNKKI